MNLGALMEEVETRRRRGEAVLAAIDAAGAPDPAARSRMAEDLALDTRLSENLRRYRDSMFNRMREMMADDAPYSAVARAWRLAFQSS